MGNQKRGDKHNRWRGGRFITSEGYVRLTLTPNDKAFYPMCWSIKRRGWYAVLEHRLVMARYLGRCLLPTEQVHHINGIKGDNRIENLRLISTVRHHKNLHPAIICPHCHKQFVLINGQPISSFI